MNTELVKVLRFDPIIDYNKKGQLRIIPLKGEVNQK